MKKKRILTSIFCVLLLFGQFCGLMSVQAEEAIWSQWVGDNALARLYSDGTLIITGSGPMWDFIGPEEDISGKRGSVVDDIRGVSYGLMLDDGSIFVTRNGPVFTVNSAVESGGSLFIPGTPDPQRATVPVTNVEIGEGITYIGKAALLTVNDYLKSVKIYSRNISIDYSAFYDPDLIDTVYEDEFGQHMVGHDGYSATVYGYSGSTVEMASKQHGITFVELDEPETHEEGEIINPADEHPEEKPIASSWVGDDALAQLYSDGTLIISGTGAIWDYSWASGLIPELVDGTINLSSVNVKIGDGISYIGSGALAPLGQAHFESVTIPPSVIEIAPSAFYNPQMYGKNLMDGTYGFNGATPIYGYAGSVAESYAKFHGIEFTALEKNVTEKTDITTQAELSILTKDLFLNTTGEEVTSLQLQLSSLGYYDGTIDGDFGDYTEAAVIAFQKANGLYADGYVGPLTREKLAIDPISASGFSVSGQLGEPVTPTQEPTIITGDLYIDVNGTEVTLLQQELSVLGYYNGMIDGDFGFYTEAAVIAFQKANGLYADGYVGPLTREKLAANPVSANIAPVLEFPVQSEDPAQCRDLSFGTAGDDVYKLQKQLATLGYEIGAVDGDFGTMTDAAVRAFQEDNGLYVDGIVGSLTKAILGIQ